jgi:prepilin-type processing-associated H-X9-DG protein
MNNLHQLGLAWVMYAGEYSDFVAPNEDNAPYDTSKTWVRGFLAYNTSASDNTNTIFLKTGLFAPYLGPNTVSIYKCAGDKSMSTHEGTRYPRVRSVSMNCYISSLGSVTTGALGSWATSPYRVFRKTTDMVKPGTSQTWVLIDEREDSINNSLFALQDDGIEPLKPAQFAFYNMPASYHGGAGALNFADGHAEIHKWVDPRTSSRIDGQFPFVVGTSSPGNKDLEWLLTRSTTSK